jgi:hypothetical protein
MLISRLIQKITDPFEFQAALADLGLSPEDMPGLTRECRSSGIGR